MNDIVKNNSAEMTDSENAYKSIRGYVIDAQRQVYSAVNSAMVSAYWNIGKAIYEICGEKDRAAYGKQVISYISERLTNEFGKDTAYETLEICVNYISCIQFGRHCLPN